jgi:uncharacterized protein with von Willebrand factor type A (vWA) domain
MHQTDARGGKSRYDVACDELKTLQAAMPGKIALLSFSDDVLFCPAGVPTDFGSLTNLAKALKFAKMADVKNIRFVVISDGEPDSETDALMVARTYKNRIDTIYVGPDGGEGQDFLRRLAAQSHGKNITTESVKQLADNVQRLLLAA